MQWAYNDWNPRMIAAGWQYWANVIPVELEAAGTLGPLIEDLHGRGLRMNVFTSVDVAMDWLVSLD